jgi:hypothetical protein
MSDAEKTRKPGRRTFLVGLLTGAGAAAAATAVARPASTTTPTTEPASTPEPVLYRRTEDTDRYYRTLYR